MITFKEFIEEGIFDRFKKKKEPVRDDITDEQRKMISSFFPDNNGKIKLGDEYALPQNVMASYRIASINFYSYDGELKASTAWYRTKEDRMNPRKSPMFHTEHVIKSDDDMRKLKSNIEASGA